MSPSRASTPLAQQDPFSMVRESRFGRSEDGTGSPAMEHPIAAWAEMFLFNWAADATREPSPSG